MVTAAWLPECAHCHLPVEAQDRAYTQGSAHRWAERGPGSGVSVNISVIVHARCKAPHEVLADVREAFDTR